MPHYVLSANAERSLTGIYRYSTEQFGALQAKSYMRKLRDRMRYLAEYPEYGRKRDDLKAGYRSYFEGAHTIYYKIKNEHIQVLDVLHQSMEPMRHLTLSTKE